VEATNQLPAAVAKKYRYGNAVGLIVTPWGEKVDLRTITVRQADELFKKGLHDLELIPAEPPKK
jgi:hypothetical protein